ncbi:MAG TPA: hypothetical protein VK875_06190 [Euzebyales bacterium]|nr:hypothetical protein [Euzebyales bacterium]
MARSSRSGMIGNVLQKVGRTLSNDTSRRQRTRGQGRRRTAGRRGNKRAARSGTGLLRRLLR